VSLQLPKTLCALDEIEDGESKGFYLEGDDPDGLSVFVVREGEAVYGYVNSCPHTGVALEFTTDRFLSADGGYILCSTHGALFEIEDGFCIAGPCAGQALRPADVAVSPEGQVVLRQIKAG
jgi:nitrite reductase/ring-hydroxylating ferredoxin subunit